MAARSWTATVAGLRIRHAVPAAQANAELLERAQATWSGRVVARTSMHDLLFTRPDDDYPFEEQVRVAWVDDVFTFTLQAEQGTLVTADRTRVANAGSVLDAFLSQLVGES